MSTIKMRKFYRHNYNNTSLCENRFTLILGESLHAKEYPLLLVHNHWILIDQSFKIYPVTVMPSAGGLRMTTQARLHSSDVQGSYVPSVRTCPFSHRVDPYPRDTPARPAEERCCDPYPANPDRHCSLDSYWILSTWTEQVHEHSSNICLKFSM